MDFEPLSLGNLLSNYVRARQPKECEKLMDKLVSQLKEELPENILGTYVRKCIKIKMVTFRFYNRCIHHQYF